MEILCVAQGPSRPPPAPRSRPSPAPPPPCSRTLLRYTSRHTWPSLLSPAAHPVTSDGVSPLQPHVPLPPIPPRPILSHPMVSPLFSPTAVTYLYPPYPRPPRDQQGNLVLQPGDCCLLILQCLCVHQMVGRWICVCVSVCVRAPHKRLSARAFALTARKKRRLTSEPQSRRGERLPRDSRQEDDCDCTRHGHGRPKATC